MILCFSGTGNSRLVALRLADRLSDRVVDIDAVNFVFPDVVTEGERIVWVMPVHSWGIPKAVRRYIRRVVITGAETACHFLVATCGDDCGLTAEMWRSEMRRRRWKAVAAHSVFMPNTYVTLPGFDVDTTAIASAKMEAMPARVDKIGHAIKCSSPIDDIHRGHLPWLKTRVLYPLFMAFLTSPHPFRSTDCIACLKCVEVCPLSNISMTDSKNPEWGDRCTLCLGCYHVCPRHAVNYGRVTRRKGQWQGALRSLKCFRCK